MKTCTIKILVTFTCLTLLPVVSAQAQTANPNGYDYPIGPKKYDRGMLDASDYCEAVFLDYSLEQLIRMRDRMSLANYEDVYGPHPYEAVDLDELEGRGPFDGMGILPATCKFLRGLR